MFPHFNKFALDYIRPSQNWKNKRRIYSEVSNNTTNADPCAIFVCTENIRKIEKRSPDVPHSHCLPNANELVVRETSHNNKKIIPFSQAAASQ